MYNKKIFWPIIRSDSKWLYKTVESHVYVFLAFVSFSTNFIRQLLTSWILWQVLHLISLSFISTKNALHLMHELCGNKLWSLTSNTTMSSFPFVNISFSSAMVDWSSKSGMSKLHCIILIRDVLRSLLSFLYVKICKLVSLYALFISIQLHKFSNIVTAIVVCRHRLLYIPLMKDHD